MHHAYGPCIQTTPVTTTFKSFAWRSFSSIDNLGPKSTIISTTISCLKFSPNLASQFWCSKKLDYFFFTAKKTNGLSTQKNGSCFFFFWGGGFWIPSLNFPENDQKKPWGTFSPGGFWSGLGLLNSLKLTAQAPENGWFEDELFSGTTVDGWNLAPPGMYETL